MVTLDEMQVLLTQPRKTANHFLGDIAEQEFSSVRNRTKYSYIMNNPLSGTDPTGYCSAETGTRFKDCVNVNVQDAKTGEILGTKSMNTMHSNFVGNVANYAASKLGSGATITGVTGTFSNGSSVTFVAPQNSTSSNGSNQIDGIGSPSSIASGSPQQSVSWNATSASTAVSGGNKSAATAQAAQSAMCPGACHTGGIVAPAITPELLDHSRRFYLDLLEDFSPTSAASVIQGITGRMALSGNEASRVSAIVGAIPILGGALRQIRHLHHPIPKFLGGASRQTLNNLDSALHTEFHSLLRQNLRDAGIPLNIGGRGGSAADWARCMTANPGSQRKAFDAIFDASRAIDVQYGTNISQNVWTNIMNNRFTTYP